MQEGARKLVEKRLGRYQSLPLEEKKQKLTAFLARRGFDWEAIKKVVDSLFQKWYNFFQLETSGDYMVKKILTKVKLILKALKI